MENYNIKNAHQRDSKLIFEPIRHVYTYLGEELASTSNVISSQFPKFDTEKWSKKKAEERGVDQQQVKDEWEMSGQKATSVGTFMHEQIENSLLGNPAVKDIHFSFKSDHVCCEEDLNINHEMRLFNEFINEYLPIPYRSEWHIFDEENMIAGTIDLVTRNSKGEYEMWDWKRSANIGRENGKSFTINHNRFQCGFGALNVLDDSSYNHYLLQQNMYAYILRKHYGINLKRMSLVVIHPNNKYFHVLDLPFREDLVMAMVSQYRR